MNRVIGAVAVVAVAALGLSACGGDDAAGDGGTTELALMVPSYGDKTQPYWEQLVKDFEATNERVKVRLEVQSWENIFDVVRTKVQGGTAPDILELDSSGPAYGKEDLLYKADEIVSERTLSDIVPAFVESAAIDGVAYGVPTVASTRALFYNKDLFAQAGIAEPPTTWDELLDAARKISALGGGVYGYGMPLGKEEAQGETSIWTYGAGGSWGDGSKITVDTPEATEALDFMKRMIDEGATQPDPGATDRTPLMNVFIQGKIGMIEGLPPVVGQVKEKNPGLNWGVAPSPTQDGEPVTLGVADYFVAFKGDDDKRDAIRAFLDFFYQQDN